MTSDQVQLLKEWFEEKLELRDVEIRGLRADVAAVQANVARLEREMGDFRDVAADLKDVAHHLDQVKDAFAPIQRLAVFALSKKTWAAVTTILIVVNWLADRVPAFAAVWPF